MGDADKTSLEMYGRRAGMRDSTEIGRNSENLMI